MEIEAFWNINNQQERSKSFSERMRQIEVSLNIQNNNEKSSKDIIATQYKIETLKRQWKSSPETNQAYERVITKYENLTERRFVSNIEYIDATKSLIKDLSELKLKDWRKLKGVTIDWWLYESMVAVYEWAKKAWEKIVEELKQNLKMLVSPEEWSKILNALWEALRNPIQFIDTVLKWIKEYASGVYEYIDIVRKNSTNKGFATEMSKYLPEVWIPLIISSVWPWKFFKILKLEKFLPERLIKAFSKTEKVEHKWWWISNFEKNVVNLLEMNFGFKENIPIEQARKSIEKFETYLTREYFTHWPEATSKVLSTLEEISDYVVKNWDKIIANKEIRRDMLSDLVNVRRRVDQIYRTSPELTLKTKQRMETLVRDDLPKAYYKLNPEVAPKK